MATSQRDALRDDRPDAKTGPGRAAARLCALGRALLSYTTPHCPRCRTVEAALPDAASAAELGAPTLQWRCRGCGHTWPQALDPFAWPS